MELLEARGCRSGKKFQSCIANPNPNPNLTYIPSFPPQGAVSILHRALNITDKTNLRLSLQTNDQDLFIPRYADANQYLLDIVKHFEKYQNCYFDEKNNWNSENYEDLRKSHLRSFTDATQTINGKIIFNRSKVPYLRKNNNWKLKKAFFLKFLRRFEKSVSFLELVFVHLV